MLKPAIYRCEWITYKTMMPLSLHLHTPHHLVRCVLFIFVTTVSDAEPAIHRCKWTAIIRHRQLPARYTLCGFVITIFLACWTGHSQVQIDSDDATPLAPRQVHTFWICHHHILVLLNLPFAGANGQRHTTKQCNTVSTYAIHNPWGMPFPELSPPLPLMLNSRLQVQMDSGVRGDHAAQSPPAQSAPRGVHVFLICYYRFHLMRNLPFTDANRQR
jgi:hypothetical protein